MFPWFQKPESVVGQAFSQSGQSFFASATRPHARGSSALQITRSGTRPRGTAALTHALACHCLHQLSQHANAAARRSSAPHPGRGCDKQLDPRMPWHATALASPLTAPAPHGLGNGRRDEGHACICSKGRGEIFEGPRWATHAARRSIQRPCSSPRGEGGKGSAAESATAGTFDYAALRHSSARNARVAKRLRRGPSSLREGVPSHREQQSTLPT